VGGSVVGAGDRTSVALGPGPCPQAAVATTVESISDLMTESRWPARTTAEAFAGLSTIARDTGRTIRAQALVDRTTGTRTR
jgi:hypothetical protein